MKKLRVTIDGKVYDVQVEILDEGAKSAPALTPVAIQPLAAAPAVVSAPIAAAAPAPKATAAPAANGATDVPSPLSGKLVSIDVKVGQVVEEGSQVATVEAMKMNTYIFAPKSGRIDSILANAGDGVDEGTVLLRIA